MSSPYSPHKIVHHQDKINEMRDGKQPVPLQVQLIISDLCNHNCSFCAYRMENSVSNAMFGEKDTVTGMVNNNPNRMIPFEKCMEVLNDCKEMGVKAIQFTGGGEPTVHHRHKELFQRTIDLGMDLALVTNGTLMAKGVPEILAQGSWVRFSIDAAIKETYSAIRELPLTFFDKAINNVKKVVEARNNNPNSNLIIGVGFVVTRENYKEIYDAVKLYSTLGVDNARISAAFTPEDYEYHREIYPVAKELVLKAKQDFSTKDFTVFNLFGERIQDLIDEKPEYDFCGYMHLNTYIGGDQNVYTCCNNAYNPIGLMGSIKNQSFKDFWMSNEKVKNYLGFKASRCERCMFNNKNRFINYMVEKNPTHVNFV